MKTPSKQRSDAQNRSMHKLFAEVADDLNGKGITQKMLAERLRNYAEIPNTEKSIKEIWKMIQTTLLLKESTTQLETKEVKEVWEVFKREVLAPYEVEMNFPKIEDKLYGKINE